MNHPRLKAFAARLSRPLTLALVTGCLLAAPASAQDMQALQAIVNEANAHANSENYDAAIALYEKAVKMAPGETQLKRNLAVLYYNRGVELQNNKQYDEAESLFDKSIGLVPEDQPAREAKAANYYYRAMDLRQAGSTDYATLVSLTEKAIELNPKEGVYKRSLASIHLGEARNLAGNDNYTGAAEVLEKAKALDPNAQAIRSSLANIYLGVASQYTDDKDQRQVWIDKALAEDSSPAIQNRAKQIAAGRMEYGNSAANAIGGGGGEGMRGPVGDWSIQDKIAAVEKALGLEPAEGTTLIARLEAAETNTYGKKQEGALNERADKIFTELLGAGQTYAHSMPNLIQAGFQNARDTYIEQIFKYTGGRVARWGRFPLKVSIESPKNLPGYKEAYREAVVEGLNAWKNATNSLVSYTIVENPLAADVQIRWDDAYDYRFDDPDASAHNPIKDFEMPSRSTGKVASALGMASMFAPGYFGLAPQAVAAGLQYKQMRKIQTLVDESIIVLGLNPVKDLPEEQAQILMRNMAAREFGHALGLKGLSDNPADLLHAELPNDKPKNPSPRDLATLQEIYSRPANIILNVR